MACVFLQFQKPKVQVHAGKVLSVAMAIPVLEILDSDVPLQISESENEAPDEEMLALSPDRPLASPLPGPGDGWKDAFMEVYSPPRVCLYVRKLGMTAGTSVDILSGYNLKEFGARRAVLDLLERCRPLCLLVSPPCTMYSQLQSLFNLRKMSPETLQMRWAEAHLHLDFSMFLCQYQARRGRFFIFEHPWRASSWERESVRKVAELPNCMKTVFDQCQSGLATPDAKKEPIKKRTTLMSNCPSVGELFGPLQCPGTHSHHHIEGSSNGVSLSWWCQMYPPPLCQMFAEAVLRTVEGNS